MKTRDGYEVEVGMVLNDSTGMYEVMSIRDNVELKEIHFDEDGNEDGYEDGYRLLTPYEVGKMTYR